MRNTLFIILFSVINISNIVSQELPKVMYVNTKDGLNQRDSPSVNGKK